MEEHGPFDEILQPKARQPAQRDRNALIFVVLSVALGVLLLVLVLPPVSILDDDSGGGAELPENIATTIRNEMPPPPAGFEAISPLLDLSVSAPIDRGAKLTVDLTSTVPLDEDVSLFTFQSDEWERLGDAEVVASGSAVTGEVEFLPTNVAAFRPVENARVVTAYLGPGAALDPRSEGLLRTLHPTGLVPAPDGQLSGGPLELANDAGTDVAPAIRSPSPDDVTAVNTILASPELRTAHVQAIADLVRGSDFSGIEIDYRFEPDLSAEFASLAQELSSALVQEGKALAIVIPLPVQQGADWDTQGFDLGTLAPLVDSFTVAPVAEQDAYYQRMEAALSFLTSQVGASKLLLTVHAFSRERSVEGIAAMSLTDALGIAAAPGVGSEEAIAPSATASLVAQNLAGEGGGLRWDTAARAVTFSYTGGGGERTVWLANLFSEAFRLDLARRYQLRGVAVEDASLATEDANVWPVVAQYAQSGEVALIEPNSVLLRPSWSVSAGTLDSDNGAQVTWQAPAEGGTHTVTLVVSDGIVRVGRELAVPVEAPAAAP